MTIRGLEGMSDDQVRFEIQRGGKFVIYSYCVSVLIMTFRRPSGVYFVRSGENAVSKGMPWILLTVVAGWWGIPWGPIYSVQSLVQNFRGGKDVTAALMAQFQSGAAPSPVVIPQPR
jgi:hypothetical protein